MGKLYIYLHEWLIFMVHVYTSPVDPMGHVREFIRFHEVFFVYGLNSVVLP